MNIENLQTQEDIEETFETDKPFDEEQLPESLGRFEWLMARQAAEFILFLTTLDVTEAQLLNIFGAFQNSQSDVRDFIEAGLRASDTEDQTVIIHPLQSAVQDILDSVEEGLGDKISEGLNDDQFLEDGGYYDKLGAVADEDIIHSLQRLKEEYPAS